MSTDLIEEVKKLLRETRVSHEGVQRAYKTIARKLEHLQTFYEDAVRKLEEAPADIRQRAADQYLPMLLEGLGRLHLEAKDWHSAADGLASKVDALLPPPPPPPEWPH